MSFNAIRENKVLTKNSGFTVCYSGHGDELHLLSPTNVFSCLTGSTSLVRENNTLAIHTLFRNSFLNLEMFGVL